MTIEEIVEKIVQAIRNGKARSVAEEELIPMNLSDSEIKKIRELVSNKLNSQAKIKNTTHQVKKTYDDYSRGV